MMFLINVEQEIAQPLEEGFSKGLSLTSSFENFYTLLKFVVICSMREKWSKKTISLKTYLPLDDFI